MLCTSNICCVVSRWAEGFLGWGLACRMRHVTSGRYLAVTEDNEVVTFHRSVATEEATAFLLRQSKVGDNDSNGNHGNNKKQLV